MVLRVIGVVLFVAVGAVAGFIVGAATAPQINPELVAAVAAASPGLLSTGLGALAGLAVTLVGFLYNRQIAERGWARENRYRYAMNKQVAFADLLNAGEALRLGLNDWAAQRPGADARAAELFGTMSRAQDVVELLGNEPVVGLSKDYYKSMYAFNSATMDLPNDETARDAAWSDDSAWRQVEAANLEERKRIIAAMRAELQA